MEIELAVTVDVVVNNPDAIARCVENHPAPSIAHPEARWRDQYYDLSTEQEVYEHLARVCVYAGFDDASRLDGWGDLDSDEVTMTVTEVETA